jgi:hypothetical protein
VPMSASVDLYVHAVCCVQCTTTCGIHTHICVVSKYQYCDFSATLYANRQTRHLLEDALDRCKALKSV